MAEHWGDNGIDFDEASEGHLTRQFRDLIADLAVKVRAAKGYCAVSGLEVGRFSPNLIFGALTPTDISSDIDQMTDIFRRSLHLPTPVLSPTEVILPAIDHGEIYGFLRLWGEFEGVDSESLMGLWADACLSLCEANLTDRLVALQRPLSSSDTLEEIDTSHPWAKIGRRIASVAALSFGADGAALRILNPDRQILEQHGCAGNVPAALIEDQTYSDPTEDPVLRPGTEDWVTIELGGSDNVRGSSVGGTTLNLLRENGVRAAVAARLGNTSSTLPIGTLTIYFLRPHFFSYRNLVLFRGFCRRVANDLWLAENRMELMVRTRMLELQAPVFAQAEVAHLLVHDLTHKVLYIDGDILELIDALKGSRSRDDERISDICSRLKDDFHHLKSEIVTLRSVGRSLGDSDDALQVCVFQVQDAVLNALKMLNPALQREKITARVDVRGAPTISGPLRVFEHILLNLVINTIDAAKQRTRTRPMDICFRVTEDHASVTIRLWDTGPGIDRKLFRNRDDIFQIGVTSKKAGTGLGLSVARNLLNRYFRGSLSLLDPSTAMFEIRVPIAKAR